MTRPERRQTKELSKLFQLKTLGQQMIQDQVDRDNIGKETFLKLKKKCG